MNEENTPHTTYQAYLLRIWLSGSSEWRASLQHVHTQQQIGFTSLGELVVYLDQHLPQKCNSQGENKQ